MKEHLLKSKTLSDFERDENFITPAFVVNWFMLENKKDPRNMFIGDLFASNKSGHQIFLLLDSFLINNFESQNISMYRKEFRLFNRHNKTIPRVYVS